MFEKKREKKEREKRYRVRAYITISWSPNASSPNTFSTAIFPYFFLPVAMFVFAIANIKTARARRNAPPLSFLARLFHVFPNREGRGYYRFLTVPSRTHPLQMLRFLWETNPKYFPGMERSVNERLSIRNWREFLFTIIAIIYFFLFRGNRWINTQGEFVLNNLVYMAYRIPGNSTCNFEVCEWFSRIRREIKNWRKLYKLYIRKD